MEPRPNERLASAFRTVSWAAASIPVFVGGMALLGWLFGLAALTHVFPGETAMKPLSALTFVLASLSVGLRQLGHASRWKILCSRTCAGAVLLVGLLSACEFLWGRNLSAGPPLLRGASAVGTPAPDLMAFWTALNFALLGLALLLRGGIFERGQRVCQVLVLTVAFIALVALLLHLFANEGDNSPLWAFTSSLPTAGLFLILAAALISEPPDSGLIAEVLSDDPGGRAARRLLPAAVTAPILCAGLIAFIERPGWLSPGRNEVFLATLIVFVFTVLVWFNARVLNREARERFQVLATRLQLAALVDSSADAIIGTTPEGIITSWNSAAEHIYGYSAQEVVGRPLTLTIPADRRVELKRIFEQIRTGQRVPHFETQHRRKDGLLIAVELNVSRIIAPADRVLGFAAIARDITERKQAEARLQRLNRALRMFSESNRLLVRAQSENQLLQELCHLLVDRGGYRLVWVGYAEQDEARMVRPVARAGSEAGYLEHACLTWADTPRGRGPVGTALRTGRPCVVQNVLTDPQFTLWRDEAVKCGYGSVVALPLRVDRRAFAVLASYAAEPDRFDAEEVELLEELASDLAFGVVTLRAREERHRAQESLRASAERYRTLITNLPVGLFRITLAPFAHLAQANPALVQMSGCDTLEELQKVNLLDFYRNSADWQRLVDVVRRQGAVRGYELAMKRKDGSPLWVALTLSVRYGPTGQVVWADGLADDITERKRDEGKIQRLKAELEERVIQRTAQLEAANKELEAFSCSVSHDLRAPLRAIDSFAHIVVEDYADRLDTEGQRLLGVVCSEAQRMGQLIDALLALSRLDRQALQQREIDMTTLAQTVIHELAGPELKRAVRWELTPLPPVTGDATLLHQVWVNLIGNGLKFTRRRDKAVIKIGGRVQNDQSLYYVCDNGAGFDMKCAPRLFGTFQRLHSAEEFEGTGVGLALVQRIIHRHGGRVWAEGKPQQGATFFFSLPGNRPPP